MMFVLFPPMLFLFLRGSFYISFSFRGEIAPVKPMYFRPFIGAPCHSIYNDQLGANLLESSTHMDDVEDIVAIYECEDTDNYFSRRNYALQWVVATGGHYNLQRGMSMAEELKFVMDCLIHRAGQGNNVPKAVYKSLKMMSLRRRPCSCMQSLQVCSKANHCACCASRTTGTVLKSIDDFVNCIHHRAKLTRSF